MIGSSVVPNVPHQSKMLVEKKSRVKKTGQAKQLENIYILGHKKIVNMFIFRELLRQEPHKNGQRKQIECLQKKVNSVKIIEMFFKTLIRCHLSPMRLAEIHKK